MARPMRDLAEVQIKDNIKITHIIFVISASLGDDQRQTVRDAIEEENDGIKVLRFVHRSTAAGVAYQFENMTLYGSGVMADWVLRVWFVTVEESYFEVALQEVDENMHELLGVVEKWSRRGGGGDGGDGSGERSVLSIVDTIGEVLGNAEVDIEYNRDTMTRLDKSQVDYVLVVGSSDQIPDLVPLIEGYFEKEVVAPEKMDPALAAVHGAAIAAQKVEDNIQCLCL